jgi:YbgC/YbaW family acyl-CoA thioester hydrolase
MRPVETSGMGLVHTEKLRVNWIDTDASGRIHYTAALRYFEVAEHGLMRAIFGAGGGPESRSFGLPRVHVEADYKLALVYPDEFTCSARVEKLGESSVSYGFEIKTLAGEVAIRGRIIAVSIDARGVKIALPPEFRGPLERAL